MAKLKIDTQKDLRLALQTAYEGRLPWLHALVLKAGYMRSCDRWLVSRTEAAEMIGVSTRTIAAWRRTRRFPTMVGNTRLYDLREILQWMREVQKAERPGELTPEKKARLKKLQEQAKLLEIERRKAQAEVVEWQKIVEDEMRELHTLKAELLEIGPTVADGDVELEEKITAGVKAALERLSMTWGKKR